MPALRARLDYIDETLFTDVSQLVFMTLLDMKPDSRNHVSHLIITQAERARLLESFTNGFGDKIDQKDQNYGVSTAKVLRPALIEHKCADEPWE